MPEGSGPADYSRATEFTLRQVRDAIPSATGDLATEAKQDTQITAEQAIQAASELVSVTSRLAGSLSNLVRGIHVLGHDGTSFRTLLTNVAGNLMVKSDVAADFLVTEASGASILAKLIAAPATEAAQTTAADARKWTKSTVPWTTDDGTGEIELTLAQGEYWVHAQAHENAVGAGAATYTLHASTTTGFTPGASKTEFYTSDADITLPNGVMDPNLSPVPISVGVAGKVYLRVIPDVGGGNTTTGSFDMFTTPNV